MATRKPPEKNKTIPDPETSAPADGVLVQKVRAENGEEGIRVVPVGETRITEAPTLLELGLRVARQQLGL
jgi:hypothetical protein